MGRLAKNLIFSVLIVSAVCVAGLSSASDGRVNCQNYHELDAAATVPIKYKSDEKNSEFWSKFRDSVMPDDKDKGKIPNYEKSPSPSPEKKPSRNKAM